MAIFIVEAELRYGPIEVEAESEQDAIDQVSSDIDMSEIAFSAYEEEK